jgi:type III secretion protein R
MRRLSGVLSVVCVAIGAWPGIAAAQAAPSADGFADRPLVLLVALAALSLLPFLLMMITSFVKVAVVLSIVRSALGTPNMPPTAVITGLAIILTVYVMAPVGMEVYREAQPLVETSKGRPLLSAGTIDLALRAADRAKEPVRKFLERHSHEKERTMLLDIARRMRPAADAAALTGRDFIVLVPAFVLSELKEAFQIGFILFVPFLVIDMVVSNILLALGMHMLSPTTVALPFKLLLFVLVDGWYLITRGLVLGYGGS